MVRIDLYLPRARHGGRNVTVGSPAGGLTLPGEALEAAASRFFFEAPAAYEEKAARKHLTPETAPELERARDALAGLADWAAAPIHGAIQDLAEAGGLGLGRVAQPIRVGVSGGGVSPPIDQTLAILGRHESLIRIDRAIAFAKC